MKLLLTESAVVTCDHVVGVAPMKASRGFVTIEGSPVLRRPDPAGRPIAGCPNVGPTLKPCTSTLPMATGASDFVTIAGAPVCLEDTSGLTDGTPPGMVKYKVRDAGQALVRAGE
ncbi:hypothetical protein DEA8626_03348 [Defluviimonas aquaemixtae]|uniref:Uncharacterized protein n=1 Tax=Albidovulum aquaemixtae TaxID=1542388 RepID=A0A2R8BLP8_9RHOB|nr:hypothetical protein [Defluviimonas aquaemixtae]SPH24298.1 hypothetical protein DEA8626_03348 [Defluviimonas aquaemixtae]